MSARLENAYFMPAKADKADVQYGRGMPKEHCGICRYYVGQAPVGLCEKVKGMIRAEMWCRLYEADSKD